MDENPCEADSRLFGQEIPLYETRLVTAYTSFCPEPD
jgi:hypothetical protein